MSTVSTADEAILPPGTLHLAEAGNENSIILSPTPWPDVNDPLNWSTRRKAVNFTLICFYVLITFAFVDIFYVAYEPIVEDIGMTYGVYNSATALQYAGLAVGCFCLMPLVYRFGRRPVYLFSLVVQLASAIWSAKVKTNGEILASNVLMGLGGAISEAIVQVTIADLFFVHQYATMNGIFLLMQGVGAYLGPVAAGYIVEAQGWRWMWWWCAIFLAVSLVTVLFFYEESVYTPVLCVGAAATDTAGTDGHAMDDAPPATKKGFVERNADAELARSTTLTSLPPTPMKPLRQRLALVTLTPVPVFRHLYQPLVVFFRFPAVMYTAITYGTLLMTFSVLSSLYSSIMVNPPWNFTPAQIGLFTIASFIGTVIGAFLITMVSDRSIIWLARRNGGLYEAEMRLYPAIPGAFICSAGILMTGIGLAQEAPWLFIAFGTAIYALGFMVCADTALSYLTDIYRTILGDALVGVILVRNGLSVVILFALTPWLDAMGVQNLTILLAMLVLVLLMLPVPLLIWGKKLRVWSTPAYRHYAKLQPLHRGM
ncbi:major facilitator superfamily transporter [Myriangium duriaei CBS 260.36]|uniref:Major facilitator superfamily transporter n=1 Tax=Myriangium duriaei CBS 260.36 TaxID=1168546 RepID=A0A9P4J3J8_9PEZI|nr:major facilitator superfamily transporter [Myriangium duriaei CBS 260.36]